MMGYDREQFSLIIDFFPSIIDFAELSRGMESLVSPTR